MLSLSNHSHVTYPEYVSILEIPISLRPLQNKTHWMEAMLACAKPHHIVTANPEILVQTVEDDRYRSIIQNADVILADGFGIVLAGLAQGKKTERFTGVELTRELLSLAQKNNLPVHFALYGSGLTTLDHIRARFPDLILADAHEAAMVIANFGAPKQEYWLDEHQSEFPNARILVGVGGALDYLTGRVCRAPRLIQALGLEWLWRLMVQPKRWKRIWNAVIVFPYYFLVSRFSLL